MINYEYRFHEESQNSKRKSKNFWILFFLKIFSPEFWFFYYLLAYIFYYCLF